MSSDPPTRTIHSHPLSPRETRHALLVAAIAWGIFGSTWMTMVGGAPFVTFVREKLHASIFMFGVISAAPSAVAFTQLWGSLIVERRHGGRKPFFMALAAPGRLMWLLIAALPWVISPRHPDARIAVFLLLITASSTLGHISTPAWFSWFGDMMPESVRARYLSKRAALATVTMAIVGLVIPALVDWNGSLLTFSAIFAVAALFGVTDIVLFRTVREPEMPPHEGPPWTLWAVIVEPMRSARFRRYLLYTFSELFMFGIAGPFFMVMALEFLKISSFRTTIFVSTIPMALTALALPFWGGVCDRFGARPLVKLGTLASIAFPICWIMATPHHYAWWIGASAVIGGIFGAAVQTGDMSMMYSLTPRESRSAYMACLMLANSLGWALAPTLSGAAAPALKPVEVHLAGMTFGNLHFLMAASLLARLLHVLFIIPRLPEEKVSTTRELARYLLCCPYRRLSEGFTKLVGDPREPLLFRPGRRDKGPQD